MRICIFGAGAIGGFVAAHLAQVDGLELSVVARGAHLQAIRERGLTVQSPAGVCHARVRATDRAAELGPQDLVFIALKQHQLAAALPDVATLLGPDTAVVPPTTGIRSYMIVDDIYNEDDDDTDHKFYEFSYDHYSSLSSSFSSDNEEVEDYDAE